MELVFEKEANIIVYALEGSFGAIAEIDNGEFVAVRNRVLAQLANMLNHVRFAQLGLAPKTYDIPGTAPATVHEAEPLKMIMGRNLAAPKQEPTAEEVGLAELQHDVNRLRDELPTLTNDQVLDKSADIVLRGLAKQLGFPVTETSPKRLTVAFVEEVRSKLREIEVLKAQYAEAE